MKRIIAGLAAALALGGGGLAYAKTSPASPNGSGASTTATGETSDTARDAVRTSPPSPTAEPQSTRDLTNLPESAGVKPQKPAGEAGSTKPSNMDSSSDQGLGMTKPLKGTQAAQHTLTGNFVRADKGTLYVQQMGAIVPLKITAQTRFPGAAQSARELKPGEEIRATFDIQNQTTNIARSVELANQSGTGGSGILEDQNLQNPTGAQPQQSNMPAQPPPTGSQVQGTTGMAPGTGGSGAVGTVPSDQRSGSLNESGTGGSGFTGPGTGPIEAPPPRGIEPQNQPARTAPGPFPSGDAQMSGPVQPAQPVSNPVKSY